MSSTVEEIKSRLGILELIESYIKVDKAGNSFRALCPFHNEKTPSFYISPDRNSYYCFGCNAKGDIFSFVQEFEGLDFLGALKLLAERTGVEIKYDNSGDKSERELLFEILEKVTQFFQSNLEKNSVVKEYVLGRGVTEETIKNWRIGYVPDGWRNIFDFLTKLGYKAPDIEKAGLIKSKGDGSYYDRFRDRAMFPISDPSGRVVGFSGRTMKKDSDEAKYINSPETLLFNKSQILFGYNFAKQSIRKNDFSILVEGQFDVILSQQSGYRNTVATSGTALAEFQIDILRRLSNRLVIAMDGDGAGFRASQKAWKMALEKGMDVKIASMDSKSDPADIVKNNPNDWRGIIKKSVHIIEFLINRLKALEEKDERSLQRKIVSEIIPYVAMIPSKIEQSYFVKMIVNQFSLSEDVVWHEVNTFVPVNDSDDISSGVNKNSDDYSNVQADHKHDKFAAAKELIGIILWQEKVPDSKIDLVVLKERLKKIIGEKNLQHILESPNVEELIYQAENLYGKENKLENSVEELMRSVSRKVLEYKREFLKKELRKASLERDSEKEKECLQKISEISKEIESVVTIDYK